MHVNYLCRIEKVNFRKVRSHAKVVGTLVTVGGAMIMTLFSGPVIGLPWTAHNSHHHSTNSSTNPNDQEDFVKGGLMITAGCLGYSMFYILQVIYPFLAL